MERKPLFHCVPFDPLSFEQLVSKASCSPDLDVDDQVKYLADYLRSSEIRARTLLIETPYFDRHYMEEFSGYYATSLRPPTSYTTRIHVFSCELQDADILAGLEDTARGLGDFKRRLNDHYRGFVVVRPLPSAAVGRTILSTYESSDSRIFATARIHHVHILGLELMVRGVPFQQQEIAVGACATTAIWSALASVARATGNRPSTPYEITQAATRHLINDRQIPAQGGLELSQVLAAVREAGFSPHAIKASGASGAAFAEFSLMLKCYLKSGIPAILLVFDKAGFHAVAALGYRISDDEVTVPDIDTGSLDTKVRLVSPGMSRIFVHEDRLGPYARMSWSAPPPRDDSIPKDGSPQLAYIPFNNTKIHYSEDPMTVYAAIVPLYPKLRLSARGLLNIASEAFPAVRGHVGNQRVTELKVDLSFHLCGDYIRELYESGLPEVGPLIEFITTIPLSRYVGIVRFFLGCEALVDVVCDTTDIDRSRPKFDGVLAFLPLVSNCVEYFRGINERYLR